MKKENKTPLNQKIKENPWILSTVVLAVLLLVFTVIATTSSSCTGFACFSGVDSAETVGQNFVSFINAKGGAQIELVEAKDFGSELYEVTVLADGNKIPAHITKDGKYLIQGIVPLVEEKAPSKPAEKAPAQEVVKSDKPNVELFIMSHCPFGTQAMKGIVPAVRALGDTIDFNLRFVNYAMHGEKEVRQEMDMYCIREEQEDKLLDYLECFLGSESGSEAEGKACLKKVGVDEAKLNTCVEAANVEFDTDKNLADKSSRFPKVLMDNALNEEYGIRGSPTLVVNGVQVSSGRDAQSYLDSACSAFTEVPELCGTVSVSNASPSPGFGYGETSPSGSNAQCG